MKPIWEFGRLNLTTSQHVKICKGQWKLWITQDLRQNDQNMKVMSEWTDVTDLPANWAFSRNSQANMSYVKPASLSFQWVIAATCSYQVKFNKVPYFINSTIDSIDLHCWIKTTPQRRLWRLYPHFHMSRAPLPIVQELNRKTPSFLLDISTSGDNDTMKKHLEKSGK